jgi:hypothetical protein
MPGLPRDPYRFQRRLGSRQVRQRLVLHRHLVAVRATQQVATDSRLLPSLVSYFFDTLATRIAPVRFATLGRRSKWRTQLSNFAPSADGAPRCAKIRRRRPLGACSGQVCFSGVRMVDVRRGWQPKNSVVPVSPVAQHGGAGLHGAWVVASRARESDSSPIPALPRRTPNKNVSSKEGQRHRIVASVMCRDRHLEEGREGMRSDCRIGSPPGCRDGHYLVVDDRDRNRSTACWKAPCFEVKLVNRGM